MKDNHLLQEKWISEARWREGLFQRAKPGADECEDQAMRANYLQLPGLSLFSALHNLGAEGLVGLEEGGISAVSSYQY